MLHIYLYTETGYASFKSVNQASINKNVQQSRPFDAIFLHENDTCVKKLVFSEFGDLY